MITSSAEELAIKFANHRKKSTGKKISYPPHLKKKAAHLAQEYTRPIELAKILGVSYASIRDWLKKYAKPPSNPAVDMIPLHIDRPSIVRNGQDSECASIKVTCLEFKVPKSDLSETISSILSQEWNSEASHVKP